MAYRIVYGQEPEFVKQEMRSPLRLQMLTAAFFLTFALLVRGIWPEGTQILQEYLIPGDPTVTQQAFDAFMEDIRQGDDLGQALSVFCEEILESEK